MTGELTLTGRVLPIGGVKEKVLGAVRAGIREIILPVDNEADIEDIPQEIQNNVRFHLAATLDDVIEIALEDGKRAKASVKQAPGGVRSQVGSNAGGKREPGKKKAGKKGDAEKRASGGKEKGAKKKG
jgi:ATP-dependent Lon protease